MIAAQEKNVVFGYLGSLGVHSLLVLAMLASSWYPNRDFKPVIYSVTLEGGKRLGGIDQAPKTDKKQAVSPPKKVQEKKKKPVKVKAPVAKKKLETKTKKKPDVVIPKEKTKPVEKKKVEKKKAPPPKKKEKPKDANTRYQEAMQRYVGESANAGGQGFGAAALGGSSMGGGSVVPLEVIQYRNMLREHIKAGWRWHNTTANLVATITFDLAANGRISNIKLVGGSGNREYDDSVTRAVLKANPAPPPPASVYQKYFRSIRMRFDPRD